MTNYLDPTRDHHQSYLAACLQQVAQLGNQHALGAFCNGQGPLRGGGGVTDQGRLEQDQGQGQKKQPQLRLKPEQHSSPTRLGNINGFVPVCPY